jgi:uncharacterized protein YlxW (UPF0749 family)
MMKEQKIIFLISQALPVVKKSTDLQTVISSNADLKKKVAENQKEAAILQEQVIALQNSIADIKKLKLKVENNQKESRVSTACLLCDRPYQNNKTNYK